MRRIPLLLAVVVLALGIASLPRLLTSRVATTTDFVHFESPHVHPMDITPSRDRIVVANTADNRVSVFDITGAAPVRVAEIPVGLEPVAVRVLNDSTAWVVNMISDDVSVVDLNLMHVRATIRTGDDPQDVEFAGTPTRAYVSVAGEDRIKVYDPSTLALTTTIPVNGSRPRSLAKRADGQRVYVAIFDGGNRTTVVRPELIHPDSLPRDFSTYGAGGDWEFPRDAGLPAYPPDIGLITQHVTFDGNWYDMYGNTWTQKVGGYVPREVDVVEIDATTNAVSRTFGDIGSNQFAIAVNPIDGRISVPHTLARNEQRFEPRLNGYLVETRLGRITQTGGKALHVLNPQINYFSLPGTQAERDSALGMPMGITFSQSGGVTYIAFMGTNNIGVINPNGGALSLLRARIRTVAGPTATVEDSTRGRIYVLGRYHNQLQTLSTANFSEIDVQAIGFDPTPDLIVNGRKFMYGGFTSAHGDQACGTCHIFGDTDNVSWNLGDPAFGSFIPGTPPLTGHDPEKGPLMTQTLRGLPNTGKLHWRADRNDFKAFNAAFTSVMGLSSTLPDSQMTAFEDFVSAMVFPPNPHQNLDRTWPDAPLGQPSAARGEVLFRTFVVDSAGRTCNSCHTATNFGPGTNAMVMAKDSIPHGLQSQAQDLKVPHLRNLYTKLGFNNAPAALTKRQFGFTHTGAEASLDAFLQRPGLTLGATGAEADSNRADLMAYLLSFDTGIAPSVGFQITFDGTNNSDPTAIATLDTLTAEADANHCDLVAKGRAGGIARGYWYRGGGLWQADRATEQQLTTAQLRALGGLGEELTVTGVPCGSGSRMGVDRDRDGYLDRDEIDNASDPGDPNSTPNLAGVHPGQQGGFVMLGVQPNPFRSSADIRFSLGRKGPVTAAVYDIMGRQVAELARGHVLDAGPQFLRWDGRAANGREVGAGVYYVRVKTEAATWNRTLVRIR